MTTEEKVPDGFKANPKSIEKFAERIDELKTDAKAAQTYAEDHLNLDGEDSRMYVTAANAAKEASDFLSRNYQRLAEIVEAAASELDKAAAMYHETEQEKAARLDATYSTEG
ncbi:type VII secretion target [Saccharomonospora glauca]|uniref:type VII secretion target n=1 Tax=Saccharomonospora glauca TaxID=40990 RepID=UPI00030A960A|nr:type VII secretion target [Saccharomonospora glauca]